jgi:hypothetical protein
MIHACQAADFSGPLLAVDNTTGSGLQEAAKYGKERKWAYAVCVPISYIPQGAA